VPHCEVSIRLATLADVPFMDGLQKQHGKALGYFPTKQFEGYVAMGGVLIAEEPSPLPSPGVPGEGVKAIGYCLSRDRYLKRDELGVFYQLCVEPGVQRKLVGAALVREVFARSAYGCKLYCCWCAQDLDANYFWESMGFIPVAFRAGSAKKRRVQIFWQRRIVEGDCVTPFWFPSQTNQGAMREDRVVLPIPPGVGWRDIDVAWAPRPCLPPAKQITGEAPVPPKTPKPPTAPSAPIRGLHFAPPPAAKAAKEKVKREKRPKVKIDPQVAAKAREFRDRYLERYNSGMVLPQAKYAVARELTGPASQPPQFLLPAA
jgi:hypothetical protein